MATNTETIQKIATSVAIIESTVQRLDKAINGNGKPGLLDRVTVIENRHCNEDKDEEENKDKKEKWSTRTWAVAMVMITQLIGLIVLFIRTGSIH